MNFDKLYGLPLNKATWEEVMNKFTGTIKKVEASRLDGKEFLAILLGVVAAGVVTIMAKLSLEEKKNGQ